MQFNLTFNKPAVRNLLDTDGEGHKLAGIRIKIENGRLMFRPSNKDSGPGVVKVEPRTRGGYLAILSGKLAEEVLAGIDTTKSHFFSLVRAPGKFGWIAAKPFNTPGNPQKFVPHLRVWRAKNAAQPKVGTARRGRPSTIGATTTAAKAPRRQVARQQTPGVAGLAEQFVLSYLKANPDFLAQHPEFGTASAPKRRGRRPAAEAAAAPPQPRRRGRRRAAAEKVASATTGPARPRRRRAAAEAEPGETRPKRGRPAGRRGGRRKANAPEAAAAGAETLKQQPQGEVEREEATTATEQQQTAGTAQASARGPLDEEPITDEMSEDEKVEALSRNAARKLGVDPERIEGHLRSVVRETREEEAAAASAPPAAAE